MSLFSGMTKTLQNKFKTKTGEAAPKASVPQPTTTIYPVVSANSLLANEKREALINNLKINSGLPKSYFDSLYYQAIVNFAEFVQNLPETQHGIYSYIGGILDHGLERAAMALAVCHAFLQPTGSKTDELEVSKQDAQWIYAVFSAALIMDVGKIVDKYSIKICEKNGKVLSPWLPFSGSVLKQGMYYSYDFEEKNRDYLRSKATAALSWTLLPVEGINWISSDKDLLEQWFAMLDEESRGVGRLISIIRRAEAMVLAKYFNIHSLEADPIFADLLKMELEAEGELDPNKQLDKEKKEQQAQIDKSKVKTATTISDKTIHTQEANFIAANASGIALLNWIKKGLENGTIAINAPDSYVHTVQEGVLLLPEMFKQYTQQNTQFAWQNIYKQFAQFMLAAGTSNEMAYRYFSNQKAIKEGKGLLIKNPHLILHHEKIPPVNNNIVVASIKAATAGYEPQVKSEIVKVSQPTLQPK